jgi:hypothetical protein
MLREICARHLHALAEPLGLVAAPDERVMARRRRQQSMGPGPPVRSA